MLDRNQPVAQIVLDHSECAEIFQRHRIDFCCRGDLSVEAAATDRGVDVAALMAELDRAVAERRGTLAADPRQLPTASLIAHIVSKHHDYLRRALPFITALASKVGRVHGGHNPKLRELDGVVDELADTLLQQLDKEEQALFPALTDKTPNAAETAQLLSTMSADHMAVSKLLEQVRAASDDLTTPEWACNSYRTLFAELRQLERDVFTHVHLENHVLKPRFDA